MPSSPILTASLNTLALTWPSWLIGICIVLFLVICIAMVLTVLIQKPQGGGLASAFGGGASAGQTAFGTKTGDALTVFTIAVFVLYLVLAVILNYAARPPKPGDNSSNVVGTPAPATTPAGNSDAPPNGSEPAPAEATPTTVTPSEQPKPQDTAAPASTPSAPAATPANVPPTPAPANPNAPK